MHHWGWNVINPQSFPHCIYCCACFIFLLLTRIQVGRGPITFSSARDNVLPPTRQKPSSRLTHLLLSSMLPFPSLGAAPNAFFFLSNSFQGHGNIGKPFRWSEFWMNDSQAPSLKAFSQINRPVLLLILTCPRQFQLETKSITLSIQCLKLSMKYTHIHI